jgi:hypothetical protein
MLMRVIYYNKRAGLPFFPETKKQSMKKLILPLTFLLLVSTLGFAQGPMISIDVIMGNRPPAPNEMNAMRAEERRHPNIAKAMHDIENSMHALHDAPDDFGGHKGQAESDLRQAYISLRKALYFRLYKDTH